MKKRLKKIWEYVSLGWCCGGGFILALLGLIISWEVALVIFCVWAITLIMTAIWFIDSK